MNSRQIEAAHARMLEARTALEVYAASADPDPKKLRILLNTLFAETDAYMAAMMDSMQDSRIELAYSKCSSPSEAQS
jgi:hypothetical protein